MRAKFMNASRIVSKIAAGLFALALAAAPDASLAATAPATVEPPVAAPKSVFNLQPSFGKDPFFPTSKRRVRVVVVDKGGPQVQKSGVPDWVVLKGFSVLKDRKLAIINNYTVEPGEEFTLKMNGQPRKFKVIEIKDSSVIIEADGVTKELHLRPGI